MKKKLMLLVTVAILATMVMTACSLFGGGDDSGEITLDDLYYYSPGEYFVTNVKDSNVLCKTSVSIAMSGKEQTEFLETNNAVIRDTLVQILRDNTEEELRADDIIDILAERMTTELRTALGTEDVYYVYINDFVVQ
ncbi:MAG: flagellar basal body-associated FliL family protein [Christensenellaceae bacterium]|jgi:flagellar FliL protein